MSYCSIGIPDWAKVVFSDETKVTRIGGGGREIQWVDKNMPALEAGAISQITAFGGGGIMIWGCITWNGPGSIARFDGTVNGNDMAKIYENELMSTFIDWEMTDPYIKFQQDNAPVHTSRIAKEALRRRQITVLSWPAVSPDLNPIENLWTQLKRRLYNYTTEAKDNDELWSRIQE